MDESIGRIMQLNGFLKKYDGIISLLGVILAVGSIIVGFGKIEKTLTIQNQNISGIANSIEENVVKVIKNDVTNEIVGEVSSRIENTVHTEIANTYQYIQEAYISSQPMYSDYNERAKLGDVYARIWMAEMNRRIGDYTQALYWYETAIENESEYRAVAYNNLGWLYVNGYGLADYGRYDAERYMKAYDCFKMASDLGLETGTRNAIEVLRLPSYISTGERAEEERRFLEDSNAVIDPDAEKVVVRSTYLHFDQYRGVTYTAENYHCKYSGTHPVTTPDGLVKTVFDYYGVIYNTDGQVERCRLVPIEENGVK
ncbi:MAG: tetratricopeptide repeat protein [Lachnospiraceae bacterium]|nr:tetratricopeptide repeat protein [Lachnospiraceae bacterium]